MWAPGCGMGRGPQAVVCGRAPWQTPGPLCLDGKACNVSVLYINLLNVTHVGCLYTSVERRKRFMLCLLGCIYNSRKERQTIRPWNSPSVAARSARKRKERQEKKDRNVDGDRERQREEARLAGLKRQCLMTSVQTRMRSQQETRSADNQKINVKENPLFLSSEKAADLNKRMKTRWEKYTRKKIDIYTNIDICIIYMYIYIVLYYGHIYRYIYIYMYTYIYILYIKAMYIQIHICLDPCIYTYIHIYYMYNIYI